MPIGPDYGETPISDEDAQALTPAAREVLGADPGKVDVYDLEQVAQDALWPCTTGVSTRWSTCSCCGSSIGIVIRRIWRGSLGSSTWGTDSGCWRICLVVCALPGIKTPLNLR